MSRKVNVSVKWLKTSRTADCVLKRGQMNQNSLTSIASILFSR